MTAPRVTAQAVKGAGRAGPARHTARGTAGVLVALLTLVGCGDPQEPAAAAPPPGESGVMVAPVDSRSGDAVLAEVASRGLDRVGLPAGPLGEVEPEEARRLSAGPAPAPIPEPSVPVDRSSPGRLLESALDAVLREDLAALARLSRSRGQQPTLTEDDALAAQRRFLAPSTQPYWERVREALARGEVELERSQPGRAVLRIQVGGAAGTYSIELREEADGWYLAG
jgi:hypothetical protein